MSDEAKKKVATATTQAKHALANVEDAAELQVEEVVQAIVEATPSVNPKVVTASKCVGLMLVGAGISHLVAHGMYYLATKHQEKKALKLVEDEETGDDQPFRGVG